MDNLPSIIAENSRLNRASIERKAFCIGLHKQGTTSLAELASLYGYRSIHSTGWCDSHEALGSYDFFSDGGSHYDCINEFPFQRLAFDYPHSSFILQTRDPLTWLLSKLAHAGWSDAIRVAKGDPDQPPIHSMWREKSLVNIDRFLLHKRNYESKVKCFFGEHCPDRLLVIDVTGSLPNEDVVRRIEGFLGVMSVVPLSLPHRNKRGVGVGAVVSREVHSYIVQRIDQIFGNCAESS